MVKKRPNFNVLEPQWKRNGTGLFVNSIRTSTVQLSLASNCIFIYSKNDHVNINTINKNELNMDI